MTDEERAPEAEPEAAEAEPELAHCKCGTNRDDKHAVVETDYTTLGTIYTLWGGTSTPIKVRFRCILCGTFFDQSTAPSICREYRNRG